jgi:hypothetical protein
MLKHFMAKGCLRCYNSLRQKHEDNYDLLAVGLLPVTCYDRVALGMLQAYRYGVELSVGNRAGFSCVRCCSTQQIPRWRVGAVDP